jgi:hypothetical protein
MKRPRRNGRPPLDDDDPSVPVTIRMPSKQFAELCKRARREDVGVPEIIRRDLHEKKPFNP